MGTIEHPPCRLIGDLETGPVIGDVGQPPVIGDIHIGGVIGDSSNPPGKGWIDQTGG